MSKNISVAMLGAYPLDTSRIWGGVQAAYAYLVKGLSRLGNLEIHILTIGSPNYSGPDRVKQGDITVHLLPSYPRFERLRSYHTYQSIINQKLGQIKPDLIHVQDAGADALVAIRSGFPTVITVHGIRWEDGKHYSSLNSRLRIYYDSLITEQYVISHARHLVVNNRYVTNYFKDILRPDVDINYLPNAIDERFFNLAPCPDEQIILFAGRVIPRKRVFDLVRSFAQVLPKFPSARLHIAGETSSEPKYVDEVRRWVQKAHLDEQVRFLGPLSQESVFQEFARCSFLALPSAQETAPLVISQAMAAGKPVVATRVGGVGEMVARDGACGYVVDVGDIDGFAAAMGHLLQCPELRADLGECGRMFAQENYRLEIVARRFYDVYQNVVTQERITVE